MIDINELRQNITTYGLEATCADDLLTLLDRLEAAEKSDAESLAMYRRARDGRDALRAEIEELHVLIAAVKKRADAEFCLRVKKEEEYTRLRAKLEAAEKKHDDVAQQLVQSEIGKRKISEAHNAVTRRLSALADENTVLRAKIEEMERQEPAYWGPKHAIEGGSTTVIVGKFPVNPTDAPLYALPGAQPELNLSDPAVQKRLAAQWGYVPAGAQVASVVKDERTTFREWFEGEQGVAYDGLRSFARAAWFARAALGAPSAPDGWKLVPLEPTHEMLNAGEDTFVPTYTGTPVSAPIDVYRAMLAAAPEAKP